MDPNSNHPPINSLLGGYLLGTAWGIPRWLFWTLVAAVLVALGVVPAISWVLGAADYVRAHLFGSAGMYWLLVDLVAILLAVRVLAYLAGRWTESRHHRE